MTDKQIKQNAEICVFTENSFRKEHKKLILTPSEEKIAKDFYIAGAHSRDEEIKELKEEIESLQEQYNTCFDGFKKRGTKLGELMKENVKLSNPWISVEDRLPDFGKMVFVNNGGTIMKSRRYRCQIANAKTNWKYVDSWNWTGKCRKVTHWMEQPKLPKGGEA